MAIELLVQHPAGEQPDRLTPIISRELFETCWRPVATRLGLGWVEMMATGFVVLAADLPVILDELDQLHAEIAVSPPPRVASATVEQAMDASARAISLLRGLPDLSGARVYLG